MVAFLYFVCVGIALGPHLYGRAAGDAVTSAAMTDQCLLGLNLMRTARLTAKVGLLKKDAAMEAAAAAAITTGNLAGNNNGNCALVANTTPVSATVDGVLLTYPQGSQLACAALLQKQLTDGLKALGNYTGQKWDNGAAAPYNNAAAQNLAYALFSASTGVGCAATNNCTAGTNVAVCRMSPTINKDFKDPPFAVEFFKALKSREEAGVDIATLTAKDLNTNPDGSGGGGGGAGSSGVPGVAPASAGLIAVALIGLISS